jgi:hypothetical protein
LSVYESSNTGVAQVVKDLPRKHKTLSSNPNTAKIKVKIKVAARH